MVGVSQVVEARTDVETGVRNRSQFSDTLHRQDPDADEPRPACPEGSYRDEAEFTDVTLAAYPTYDLCGNPECFGREWR